ncbi:MAG: aspartate dehydrogenase [Nitrososphaerota archaeon]|nr:aspartate dehydrogenase [Candidatus Bathyarchaeota archaeon]MDW8048846.1 aspartate dehydrogenase [Nitrososphaerota archaeon]
MKIGAGLIGCGSIGTVISRAIDEGKAGNIELVAVYDLIQKHAEKLVQSLSRKPVIARSADELFENINIHLIIEAASQEAVKQYAFKAVEKGKDLMVLSTGALLDDEFLANLTDLLRRKGKRLFIPSGAIVGVDNVKSATIGRVHEVTLITRKPPISFEGSAFIAKSKIDPSKIKEPIVLFDGSAREAVKLFPQNVNVSATLSLAGIGPDRTRVKIITDPNIKEITHEVYVKGDFGEFWTKTVNKPFPSNPRTSYVAALSAIAALKRISENIVVGT